MNTLDDLYKVLKTLRDSEKGCAWDKIQTSLSLIPNFIEEVYEAVEAIEAHSPNDLKEELGDILLHIVFQIQLAEEQHHFTLADVLSNIINKLIRRHPHIFADTEVHNVQEIKLNWEKIKLQEKRGERKSVLDGVPLNMPALIQAQRIQEKAAAVGFDWDNLGPVFEKINEEIAEVKDALVQEAGPNLSIEIGDLIFTVVNLARKLKIDSETALRSSNKKFITRFHQVELLAQERNINLHEVSLEVLDELWEIAKKEY